MASSAFKSSKNQQTSNRLLLGLASIFLTNCGFKPSDGFKKISGEPEAAVFFSGAERVGVNSEGYLIVFWQPAQSSGSDVFVERYEVFHIDLGTGEDLSLGDSQAIDDVNGLPAERLKIDSSKLQSLSPSLIDTTDSDKSSYTLPWIASPFKAHGFFVRPVGKFTQADDEADNLIVVRPKTLTMKGCIGSAAESETSISIRFDFPTAATKVLIYRSDTLVKIETDKTVTQYLDTNLQSGKEYTYRCDALVDDIVVAGETKASLTTKKKPIFEGCGSSLAIDANRIEITYIPPPEADEITIDRNGKEIFRTDNLQTTTYIDSGLNEGETYEYRCNGIFEGDASTGTKKLTQATVSSNPPAFPGISSATANTSSKKITVSWGLPSTGVAATTIKIFAKAVDPTDTSISTETNLTAAGFWNTPLTEFESTSRTEIDLQEWLGDELTYLLGVRACSAAGHCDQNTKTKSLTIGDFGPPKARALESIELDDGKITIESPWIDSDGGFANRRIYWREGMNGPFTLLATILEEKPWEPDTGLTLEPALQEFTTYQFYVANTDGAGNESVDAAVHVITLPVDDLTPPQFTGLSDVRLGNPADSVVTIEFTPIASQPGDAGGANEYLVYVLKLADGESGSACDTGIILGKFSASNFVASQVATLDAGGLDGRSRYSVCLKARDVAKNVSITNTQSQITTRDLTPPIFSGASSLTFDNGNAEIDLTWDDPADADLKEFHIVVWRGSKTVPQNKTTIVIPKSSGIGGSSVTKQDFAFNDFESLWLQVLACDDAAPLYGDQNCTPFDTGKAIEIAIPDVTPPQGFGGITSVNQSVQGTLTVNWGSPTGGYNGYRGFKVYHNNSGSLELLYDCACSANNCPGTPTSCVISVDAYRTLNVHVRPYDTGGNIADYAPLTPPSGSQIIHRTLDTTPPNFAAGAGLTIGGSPTYLLGNNAATDNQYDAGASLNYWWYRKKATTFLDTTDPHAELASTDVVRFSSTTTTATDTDPNLVEGTTYFYSVCAEDATGNRECPGGAVSRIIADLTAPTVTTPTSDYTNSSTTFSVSFSVNDNYSSRSDLSISVYRTVTDSAETPAKNGPNLVVTDVGSNLSCNPGPCQLTGQTGPVGVAKKINYSVVVVDEESNTVDSSPLTINWDNEPVSVTSILRNSGPEAGGTLVVITGSNFVTGATVNLGTTACTNVVVESDTTLTCTTGNNGGSGITTVWVTNLDGRQNVASSTFNYNSSSGHVCDNTAAWGAEFAGGDGTVVTPFQICTATHLQNIAPAHVTTGEYFKIEDHIDLSGIANWAPIGTGASIFSGHVRGTNDGSGHPMYRIHNLAVNSIVSRAGLFGRCDSGDFDDLLLTNPSVTASDSYVAALCGQGNAATINNVDIFNGTIVSTANYSAGVIGYTQNDIDDVRVVSTSVTGVDYVGGIVGNNHWNDINNAEFSGTVSGTDYVGGIFGKLSNANVNLPYSNFTVSGTVTGRDYVGGIVGQTTHRTNIENATNSADVSGRDYVGGIQGGHTTTNDHTLSNVSNSGIVTGTGNYVGGIIGADQGAPYLGSKYTDLFNSGVV